MIENLRGYWTYRLLDRLRMDDPRQVVRLADAALERVDRRLIPWILGAYGSALRRMTFLREAFEVEGRAVQLAEHLDDQVAKANLQQRLAHVLSDFGDNEKAIEYSKKARWFYYENGETIGEGRTLVDQGKWHFNLQQYSKTIECHRRALKLLPARETNNRFAAYLGHAYCYEQFGELGLSEKWSGLAEDLIEDVSPTMATSFLWYRGKLAMRRGFHDVGVERFRAAYDFYIEREYYLYAAACSVELCEALILCQRQVEADEIARELIGMVAFVENECVQGAVAELSDYIATGRPITLRLLADLRNRMEEIAP